MGNSNSGGVRKPSALKAVQGTSRPDRDNPNEPEPEVLLPLPPDDLTPEQLQYYYDFGHKILGMGVLTEVDGAALSSLAVYWDEWRRLTKTLEDEGIVYKTVNSQGYEDYKRRPEWTASIQAFSNLKAMLGEFGLTPASRSKVSVTAKGGNRRKKGGDPWTDL